MTLKTSRLAKLASWSEGQMQFIEQLPQKIIKTLKESSLDEEASHVGLILGGRVGPAV